MLSRLCLSPLRYISHPLYPGDVMFERVIYRGIPSGASISPAYFSRRLLHSACFRLPVSLVDSSVFGQRFNVCRREELSVQKSFGKVFASQRDYKKIRRRPVKRKDKELEFSVDICIEEELPDDPKILEIAELLRLNVPMAMKLALNGLNDSEYKTRDPSVDDIGSYETVELSVLLCNDGFIRKLNKEWRDEDKATDVLSMSQHIPELKLPILMLGDIVISIETAARQAEERGHTLLDEIRILLVHGLLHLLGFDHELSIEAEAEMEKEEGILLTNLGWKGKGLIQSANIAEETASSHLDVSADVTCLKDRKKEVNLQSYKPKFSYVFCDMDGTLLNSRSLVSSANAEALKEALSRGVKVVIATGKTRPAVINVLSMVDLAGKNGIISEFSPGVFIQGLIVYGRQGREISRRNLDPNICREAFLYSLDSKIPLIAFSGDRCLTLFDHPLVDSLHTVYHEPKAEIMSSIDHLLTGNDIQKVIYLDTAEGVTDTLRPYWSAATSDRAAVVQAVPDMLEIVPPGTSKGDGVKMLLDHLGVTANEIMAIGDGENDVEMLELASLGIALNNGSAKAKAVANIIGLSNDEDGVADAIYRYAF